MRRPTLVLSLNAVKGHDFVQKPYRVMPLGQIAAHVMANVHWFSYSQHTCQAIDLPIINSSTHMPNYLHSCNQHTVHFCISIKGHTFVKNPRTFMVLGQIVALVMVKKHMKYRKICFNTIAKVKVKFCHNDDDDYALPTTTTTTLLNFSTFFLSLKDSELKI